jgi:hypothetical protein
VLSNFHRYEAFACKSEVTTKFKGKIKYEIKENIENHVKIS